MGIANRKVGEGRDSGHLFCPGEGVVLAGETLKSLGFEGVRNAGGFKDFIDIVAVVE